MRLRPITVTAPPQYYQCPLCDLYHEIAYAGDCDEAHSHDPAELDDRFGWLGWEDVELPAWDIPLQCE